MDHSLTPADKKIWIDVFGPGYDIEGLSQATVDEIVSRITPCLTVEKLRIGKLIPFLEKRNVIPPDLISHYKTLNPDEQVSYLIYHLTSDPSPPFLFRLYTSLLESGNEVPLHHQLACDIKEIIQTECGSAPGSGHTLLQSKIPQTKSSTLLSQLDTSVSTRNISGAFCALPVEATPTPTATRDQATHPNYSGEVSITHRISVPAVHSTDGSAGQFVPGTALELPSEALSGVDEPLSSVNLSVKNTFSLPDDSLGSSPLSQANDLGGGASSSLYQNNQLTPPMGTTLSSPPKLCDPELLTAFQNPSELEVFSILVQTGAVVNLPTNLDGSYLLHLAVQGGSMDKVQILLQNRADTNVVREDGKTPLHLACEQGFIELVKLLVDGGANVNALDNSGIACLHLTSTVQVPDIVVYLIEHGAMVDIHTKVDFNTPLAIVAGLLTDTATQCVSILLSAGASVNGLPQSAVRPLVAAAASGHLGTVELLLQREPEVNIRNKDGTTALLAACLSNRDDVIHKLTAIADIDVNISHKDGMTPLMAAVQANNQQVVQLLLDRGADLNCVRMDTYTISGNMILMRSTALSDAAYRGHLPLVKLLKERGASMTAVSQEVKAPIIFAAMGGHADIIDFICSHEVTEENLLEAFEAALKHHHNDCAVALLNSSTSKDRMMEVARSYDLVEHLIKGGQPGDTPAPSSLSSQTPVPSASQTNNVNPSSPLDMPVRATLDSVVDPVPSSVYGDYSDLFTPVPSFPPRRAPPPSQSRSTHHDEYIEQELMLGTHREKLIEILHEFAQVCLLAAVSSKTPDWLVDKAAQCSRPHLVQFFSDYYMGTAVPQIKMLDEFFNGKPSALSFLVQWGIISKASVKKVLNEMGRNDSDFFQELTQAFHQIPGAGHLPYDPDQMINGIFGGSIMMGQRYRPSSPPPVSRGPTQMSHSGGHRLGGGPPPTSVRDNLSHRTGQQTNQPGNQQTNQPGNRQTNQPGNQQTNQPGNQQTNQPGNQQTNQPGNRQTNQPGNQQTNQPGNQQTNQPGNQQTIQLDNQQTNQPGNQQTNQPGNQQTNQPGNQQSNQPGNQQTNQLDNQQINQPGNQQSNQLGNQQTNQPGNQQTNQPGNQQSNQPGNQQTNQLDNQQINQPGNQQSNQLGNQQTNQPGNQQTNQLDNQQINQQINQPGNQQSNQLGNQQTNQPGNQQTNQLGNQQTNQQTNQPGNQQTSQPGNQQTNQLGNQQTNQLGNNQSNQLGNNQSNQLGNNQSNQLGNNQSNQLGNQQTNQPGNQPGNHLHVVGKSSVQQLHPQAQPATSLLLPQSLPFQSHSPSQFQASVLQSPQSISQIEAHLINNVMKIHPSAGNAPFNALSVDTLPLASKPLHSDSELSQASPTVQYSYKTVLNNFDDVSNERTENSPQVPPSLSSSTTSFKAGSQPNPELKGEGPHLTSSALTLDMVDTGVSQPMSRWTEPSAIAGAQLIKEQPGQLPQPLRNEVTQGGAGEVSEMAVATPQESSAGSQKRKLPSVPAASHPVDASQKQKTTPFTKGPPKTSSRSTTAPVPGTHPSYASKTQQPPSKLASKPRGSPSMGTPSEQKTKGKPTQSKVTGKSTDTAVNTGHGHNVSMSEDSEKRGVDVEGESKEDKETHTQWSHDHRENNSYKQLSTESLANIQPQGQLPDPSLASGGMASLDSSFNCCIDNSNEATRSTDMHRLKTNLEDARTRYTHARVTLKYVNVKTEPSDTRFMAAVSHCHLMICALCSYVQCSRVEVTVCLFNF